MDGNRFPEWFSIGAQFIFNQTEIEGLYIERFRRNNTPHNMFINFSRTAKPLFTICYRTQAWFPRSRGFLINFACIPPPLSITSTLILTSFEKYLRSRKVRSRKITMRAHRENKPWHFIYFQQNKSLTVSAFLSASSYCPHSSCPKASMPYR